MIDPLFSERCLLIQRGCLQKSRLHFKYFFFTSECLYMSVLHYKIWTPDSNFWSLDQCDAYWTVYKDLINKLAEDTESIYGDSWDIYRTWHTVTQKQSAHFIHQTTNFLIIFILWKQSDLFYVRYIKFMFYLPELNLENSESLLSCHHHGFIFYWSVVKYNMINFSVDIFQYFIKNE